MVDVRASGWWLGGSSHSSTASGRGLAGDDVKEVDVGAGEDALEEVGVGTNKGSWAGGAAGGRL